MSGATELGRKFAELVERKKRNASDEADISKQMAAVEESLLNAMSEEGLQNLKLDSGLTLYRATDKFYGAAEGVEKSDLVKELGRHQQTMDLVEPNYNANSLRARMKEIEANGESLPPELEKMIHVTEKFRVRHRSS